MRFVGGTTSVWLAWVMPALFALTACSSKGTEGTCAAGATCGGGNPAGTWDVAGRCEYAAAHPDQALNPQEQSENPIFPSLTPTQAQQTTDGDWCSGLYYTPADNRAPDTNSKVKAVNLYHDAPALTDGQVTFSTDANGAPSTYNVSLNFATYNITHFAPLCLQFYGATPSCGDLATNLADFYAQAAGMDSSTPPNPNPPGYENIACQPTPDGGCDCGYDYKVRLADSGAWSFSGTVITESSAPSQYMYNGKLVGTEGTSGLMVASTCQSGDTLTLTGYNGQSLSNAPGLRVLTLTRHM
ncbi:MAG TPA: hypothetical protein VGM44_18955 [Polyangiaceae bacterium]